MIVVVVVVVATTTTATDATVSYCCSSSCRFRSNDYYKDDNDNRPYNCYDCYS